MARKFGRAHRSKIDGATAFGVALGVVAIAMLAGLIIVRLRLGEIGEIDPDSLCPAHGPSGYVAIVVDATDPISPVLRQRVRMLLDDTVRSSPPGSRISFGAVRETISDGAPTIPSLCHPGDPAEANPIYENPRRIAERFEERFIAPAKAEIELLVGVAAADRSPIMEAIQSIVIDAFPTRGEEPRRLVVVSDLLQNSDVFSFYRGQRWEDFAASPGLARVGRTLEGVDVELIQLPSLTAASRQDDAMLEFWRRYFEAQGARSVRRTVLGDL